MEVVAAQFDDRGNRGPVQEFLLDRSYLRDGSIFKIIVKEFHQANAALVFRVGFLVVLGHNVYFQL
jgi:hypothetical protein